jgi:X-X-X-Leu-X-X-Gly heptad repeat protein
MADSDYSSLFSPQVVQAYIAKSAQDRGIDPNVALRVFQQESGFSPFAKGDKGSSPGVAQLHFGGVAPGVLSHPGLGDDFSQTGMSAYDPATWPQQIDFALDNVKNHGWTDYATTRDKLGMGNFTGISSPGAPMPNAKSYSGGAQNIDPESLWVGPQQSAPAQSQSGSQPAAQSAVDPESLWVGPKAASIPASSGTAANAGTPGPGGLLWDANGGRDPNTGALVVAGKQFSQPPASQAVAATSGFLNGIPLVGPALASGAARLASGANALVSGAPNQPAAYSAAQDASSSAYPKTALGANVAGGVAGTVPMMMAAPSAFGLGVANPLMAGASSGATGAILGGSDAAIRSGGDPSQTGQGALLGGAFGAAAPIAGRLIGGATNALGNATIGSLPTEDAALAVRAQQLGIPVNAGQMAPQNSFTKYASSALNQMPFSGNDPSAIQTGVNRAISNTIGENATRITPDVMNAARTRIGNDFDTVANNTTLKVDGQFGQDLVGALNDPGLTKSMPEYEALQRQIGNVFNSIDQSSGTIDGHVYQTLTNANSPLSKLSRNANPTLANGASDIKDALDGLLERSAPPDMQDLIQQARSQWKSLKTIEPLAANSPTGDINPVSLAQRINSSPFSKNAMAYGRAGDLGDIAAIGKRFLQEPPNSGTATRNMIYSGLGAAAGGFGLNEVTGQNPTSPLGMGAALSIPLGLLAGRFAGSALRSPMLANALINRSISPLSAAARPSAAAANLLTRTLGPDYANPAPGNALGWSVTPAGQ